MKRMSISLTVSDVEKLSWLAENQKVTQSEALRRAISTERKIQEAIQEGDKIIIKRKDGTSAELIFIR